MDAPAPPLATSSSRPLNSWSWPRSLELGLALVLGICAGLVLHSLWSRFATTGQPAQVRSAPGLDVIQANVSELAQVPGVGPKRAQRIVQERETRGSFNSPDDLQRVHGMGGRTVDRVRK